MVIPELTPWYIDIYKPMPLTKRSSRVMSLEPVYESNLASADAKDYDAKPKLEEAYIQNQLTQTYFAIKAPVTLNNKGNNYWIPLSQKAFKVKQTFAWYPNFGNQVLRSLSLNNEFEFPILPGKLTNYIDVQYLEETRLPLILKQGKFNLSLGQVQSIIVKREAISKYAQESGFFDKTKIITYEMKKTIQNNQSQQVTLNVYYRLPVSTNEIIKVQIETPTDLQAYDPEDTEFAGVNATVGIQKQRKADNAASSTGLYQQKIGLKPKQKVDVPVRFKISYPQDEQLQGLP